ncbi:MAG: M23 family metallopeptidase [Anaerolineae bacterium]|nr:M23 family metallopeptidase [Anaerolineae bacterium]
MGTQPEFTGSLDDRLRREEPPISDEDTNPGRTMSQPVTLAEQLRRDEPPFHPGDTSPSRSTHSRRRRSGGRWLALVVLVGVLALAGIAALISLTGETNAVTTERDLPTGAARNVQGIGSAPTQIAQAQDQAQNPAQNPTPAPPVPTQADLPTPPDTFPTAASDVIAAALMLSAPGEAQGRAVQRENAPFTIRSGGARAEVVQYVVQDGDTLESIAADFDLNDYYTLIWSNKTNKYNPLRAGNTLNVLPVDGVYYEVSDVVTIRDLAAQYSVEPYDIIDSEYNNLFGSTPDTLLVTGMWVVVPGGEAERELFLAAPTNVSGSGSGGAISGTYSLWGCTANVGGGSPPYSRPLASYTWIRGFVPGGHTGVDIAPGSGQIGEPVFAAGAGTVVYAGSISGGYGNVVVLAHGSTFSLYAHLNSVNVSCSQQVGAGDVIGRVGSTGNSSGPHLHFEVRDANFNVLNPQSWVQF